MIICYKYAYIDESVTDKFKKTIERLRRNPKICCYLDKAICFVL